MSDAPERLEFVVDDQESGERVDCVISDHLPDMSRSQIQHGFTSGEVRVDGTVRAKSYRVEAGQTVAFTLPVAVETRVLPQAIELDHRL